MRSLSFRRAPHLVTYWREGRLIIENYRARQRVVATPEILRFLDGLDRWMTLSEIGTRLGRPTSPADIGRAISGLARLSLVESGKPDDARKDPWTTWDPWAGFFHYGTKDLRYHPGAAVAADRQLRRKAAAHSPPRPTKAYPRPRLRLPAPQPIAAPLAAVLSSRRTWRRFGSGPVPLDRLSTLLWYTWGVQSWVDIPGQGRIALKTSPSGGAQHPGEVYILARHVEGLAPALYHYDAAGHCLARISHAGARLRPIQRYLPSQPWYRNAGALCLMTAVIPREAWKYDSARAYRALLIDAGHLCQTFCLVATGLELAPFCSMALADSKVEADLQLDGSTEVALYAAGIGTRPPNVPLRRKGTTCA